MSWHAVDWPALQRAGLVYVHSISGRAGAGLQNQVSLAAVPGRTLYLKRVLITGGPVTAAISGEVVITGIQTDDGNPLYLEFTETVSAGSWLDTNFDGEPQAATAANSAITVTLPVIAGGSSSAIILSGWSV